MRTIASTAVLFALLTGGTNTHSAIANLAHQTSKPTTQANAQTAVHPAAKPAETGPPPAATPVMVTVQPGDTLSGIASDNNTTYPRLFDANESVSDPNVITVGQQLRIPTANEQLPDRAAPVVASPAPAAITASAPVSRPRSVTAYPAVAGNDAKAFIYSHESGNNPNSTNPKGCYGLGQDCNGRVAALCGADYACQDAYFTNYATSRYGGWSGALAFWQSHGWW